MDLSFFLAVMMGIFILACIIYILWVAIPYLLAIAALAVAGYLAYRVYDNVR
ncbi:hypothetical protein AB0331_17865 [Dietzia maris]|uniref:hypothetical protein n=1 Tax=Dietzia maris TaxID=37915 RepID=UPI00344CCF53